MEMDVFSERTRRMAARTLFGLALAYAFVAGLRTVADFDVGWLLALGRYLVTHHAVPRTDVLSYTASGVPWIYPPVMDQRNRLRRCDSGNRGTPPAPHQCAGHSRRALDCLSNRASRRALHHV